MKKIVLMCCLAMATSSLVFGQSAQVSKKDFTTRVSRLNQLLDQSKAAEAKTAWEEVNRIMMTQLDGLKAEMKAAASANNAAEKDRLTKVAAAQFDIYSSVIRMRDNMVQNRTAIKTKLDAFAASL